MPLVFQATTMAQQSAGSHNEIHTVMNQLLYNTVLYACHSTHAQ